MVHKLARKTQSMRLDNVFLNFNDGTTVKNIQILQIMSAMKRSDLESCPFYWNFDLTVLRLANWNYAAYAFCFRCRFVPVVFHHNNFIIFDGRQC